MIYLASPYTAKQSQIMEQRFMAARAYAYSCMERGELIFSPIAYGHQFAVKYNAGTDWQYWATFSLKMIEISEEVRVLKLFGWDRSKGVAAEIQYAEIQNIPVTYVDV